MVTAIYPGTFDPITNGHIDIMQRATELFEKTYLAVADSTSKKTLFSLDERIALARDSLSGIKNIEVVSFDGLVTDLARKLNAKAIIRGIRAVSDYDYEFQMAGMNRRLLPGIETVFLTPSEHLTYISSSLVREIASYNGDVNPFVHSVVEQALKTKFS